MTRHELHMARPPQHRKPIAGQACQQYHLRTSNEESHSNAMHSRNNENRNSAVTALSPKNPASYSKLILGLFFFLGF